MHFEFQGEVHRWDANPAFFLVSLPNAASAEIREISEGLTNGFGSLKVEAKIGDVIWRTSIFPNSASGVFDLPLKADVRKKNGLTDGALTAVAIEVIGF